MLIELLTLALVYRYVHGVVDFVAQYILRCIIGNTQCRADLKELALKFKAIITRLNNLDTKAEKQAWMEKNARFIEEFANTMASSNRKRCLGMFGSAPIVLMFRLQIFPVQSVHDRWLNEYADVAFTALMVCAHTAFLHGEFKDESVIDDLVNSMNGFSGLYLKVLEV
jgi:hypothetical protein